MYELPYDFEDIAMKPLSLLHRALAVLALSSLLTAPAVAAPITLDDAYRSALKSSESIGIADSKRDQAREGYRQARGGILPHLSASAGYLQSHASGLSSSALSTESETSAKLTLQQPLFRGLREFAGLRASAALQESADLEMGEAKQDLYRAVSDSFYSVLSAERDRSHLQELHRLTGERLKELRARERVGRSRRSEVLSAESRQEAVAAAIRAADSTIAEEREMFTRITALGLDTELASPPNPAKEKPPIGNLDSYLGRLDTRFDLRSLRKQVEAADEGVGIAKGAHLPEIDLLGNYYLKRPESLDTTTWDFSLTVTLPLFSGGITQSVVRESAALRRETELRYESARREAVTEIRTLHRQTELLARELEARERAARSAQESYETHQRDYRFGLATNLEVFEALNSAIESRRERDRTYFSFWATLASLEIAGVSVPAAAKEAP